MTGRHRKERAKGSVYSVNKLASSEVSSHLAPAIGLCPDPEQERSRQQGFSLASQRHVDHADGRSRTNPRAPASGPAHAAPACTSPPLLHTRRSLTASCTTWRPSAARPRIHTSSPSAERQPGMIPAAVCPCASLYPGGKLATRGQPGVAGAKSVSRRRTA